MAQWKAENLAGCTGELCNIAKLSTQYVVINSMSREEQILAYDKIKDAKQVDLNHLPIFNDPDLILTKIFAMEANELKTVNNRTVYLPQAIVCNANGLRLITDPLFNTPKISGEPRSSEEYLEKVDLCIEATLKATPPPLLIPQAGFNRQLKSLKRVLKRIMIRIILQQFKLALITFLLKSQGWALVQPTAE